MSRLDPTLEYCQLPEPLRPLLDKFYRGHRSSMRGVPGALAWVARQPAIIAALNLTTVDHGVWLTGLLVDPAWRDKGVASALLQRALVSSTGPVWLFCHPSLCDFYARLGFTQAHDLPPLLEQRLRRYQRSKPLLAMVREP